MQNNLLSFSQNRQIKFVWTSYMAVLHEISKTFYPLSIYDKIAPLFP